MSDILGFRKDGRPILPIKGGSEAATEPVISVPVEAPPVTPAPPVGKVFTEDEVNAERARIRQEEKDKLYGKVSSLEEQLRKLADEAQARKDEADAKAKEKAELAQAKFEEEASAKELLSKKEQEWNGKFEELRNQAETERVLREKERELAALQQYIQQRVNDESNNLAPELIPLITGSNKDEVESSIAQLKVVSQQIAESVANNLPQAQPVPNLRGVPVTGNVSAGGPFDGTQQTRNYTAAELAAMPVTSPEYLAVRKAMGIGQNSQNQGLFG